MVDDSGVSLIDIARLALVASLSQLTACGGGGGGGESVDTGTSPAADQVVHGYVHIEQRLGHYVLDAWFTHVPPSIENDQQLWESGTQYCDYRGVQPVSTGAIVTDEQERAGTRWREALFAGQSIDISSRGGTLISLHARQIGDAFLYATDERWFDAPLPDDARLSVEGSELYPAFDSLALSPMSALVRELPTSTILQPLTAPIAWQASDHADDRIELTISGNEGIGNGSGITIISCSLADDGHFSLPEPVQNALGDETSVQISLVRQRKTSFYSGDASLEILQLAYP